jgi:CheY-like chemotaxis protein
VSRNAVKKKVLVVDDESDILIFLSTLLKSSGFDPVIAENELDGLQKARDLNPSCIILNAMLPHEGGISMYLNLKCDQQLKTVPVIMLSSVASRVLFYMQQMKSAHARDVPQPEAFMEIPPDAEELLRLVHQLSRKKESQKIKQGTI